MYCFVVSLHEASPLPLGGSMIIYIC